MYFDNAEGMVFRPPSEANSLILRVTIGCSHNACSFCSMYRNVSFRVRSLEELQPIITSSALYDPSLRRIFLADGNALVLPTNHLLDIINRLHFAFPKLSRVTCYAGPKDILNKSPEELTSLRKAGLRIIYLGIESGDDNVLTAINKGVSSDDMIAAGRRVLDAGIKLSTMVILGLGGVSGSRNHALETARIINSIQPTMLNALSLMLYPGTPLRQAAETGSFNVLSPYELLLELRQLIANIQVKSPCLFRSDHTSNFLPLSGTLPKDKDEMLATIEQALKYLKTKNTPTYNEVEMF